MKLVIDIEANGLVNPTQIWCIVCKDIDTGDVSIFREPTKDDNTKRSFLDHVGRATLIIGHNWLGYDYPVLQRLLGFTREDVANQCIDTLIISKLVDYSRPGGHSIESYGQEFGIEKIKFSDFTKWSQKLEDYCVRDVEICGRIYNRYSNFINDPSQHDAILTEHRFELRVNDLHNRGFSFNSTRANKLLQKVVDELSVLDKEIEVAFPPKLKLVREIQPKETKHGTLSKTDFRFVKDGDLSEYNGGPFCRCVWCPFNPSSHKQLIEVLTNAGWEPEEKTGTHIETERAINRLKYIKNKDVALDLELKSLYSRLEELRETGWKINEANLNTLPQSAPSPARALAKRILLEARRRTLTEWLGLVQEDGRIHGKYYGIGAWTHRMAHQQPNTANIPTDVKLYGKEMRSLWQAPRSRLLVGVDAESIQLRIFAHYINDPEFTDALVRGRKDDKTDPHSLNQRILGDVCKSRQIAKRFIYALLLGAGLSKLAQILECSESEAREALDRLLRRYQGWQTLKEKEIPNDARRGYFIGLDGRRVRIPGDTESQRKHLCMSGYLQNGEAIIMKKACLLWTERIEKNCFLVNFVHDEWQTEVPNNMEIALKVAKIQADSLREVGEKLKLRCPLAGSYWNEDHRDYTIGPNWSVTH